MPLDVNQPGLSAPPAAPAVTAARLAAIWGELLGLEGIGPDDNYFDLGGDSSLAVQLFARIEQEFGRKLPPVALFEAPTIRTLSELLGGSAPGFSGRVIPLQPDGCRPPLFLIHDASGDVFGYRALAQRLGPEQPVYGIRAAGLDGEAEPVLNVEDMAAAYVPAIRSVQPAGPYYLAGYCGGGTVAYEVAQQLVRSGQRVAFVGLLDTSNWSALPKATAPARLRKQAERLIFHFEAFARLNSFGKKLLWRQKVKILRARVPVWRGRLRLPGAAAPRLSIAAVWAANDRACAQYRAQPYPGRVTEFRPKWRYRRLCHPLAGWESLARNGSEIRILPLYPATMLLEPYVADTAAALRLALEDARRAAEASLASLQPHDFV